MEVRSNHRAWLHDRFFGDLPGTIDHVMVTGPGPYYAPLADDAARGLGTILEAVPGSGVAATDVVAHAKTAREDFLAGLLDTARDDRTVPAG